MRRMGYSGVKKINFKQGPTVEHRELYQCNNGKEYVKEIYM